MDTSSISHLGSWSRSNAPSESIDIGSRGGNGDVLELSRSRLEGRVAVSGAKNSALRLLVASLLTCEPIVLRNYPHGLLDAELQVKMLEKLGKTCLVERNGITISEAARLSSHLTWEGRSIRNTLLLLGALVARLGEAAVPLPGGCNIGDRKYDLHELVLRSLGADVWVEGDMLFATAPNGLAGADIHLPFRSTGATENAILCAALAKGETRVWNPHVRPEVLDLIAMLGTMGVHIEVYGQESIHIVGKESLSGTQYTVIPDNLEAITWLIGAVMTGGDIEIDDFPAHDLEVPLIFLRESGAKFSLSDSTMRVSGGRCYPVDISTGPYPGINSDMQPLFAAFGACARGESRIVDLRFPNRFSYIREFSKLGVQSKTCDGVLRIQGGLPVNGGDVTAVDLRAGIALVLLGLTGGAETRIRDAWQIDRGYVDLPGKLRGLGASVSYRQ